MNRRQAIQAIGGGALTSVLAGKTDAKVLAQGDLLILTVREGFHVSIPDFADQVKRRLPALEGRFILFDGIDATVVRLTDHE